MEHRDRPRQRRDTDAEQEVRGFDYGAGFTVVYSDDAPETEWVTGQGVEVRR